ncbi:hypothetical protein NQ314_017334 [Rhamnusium bicolor]|uniref:Uncharacterized protein n=1 Tax=Rhamnusium bicolor TaxID=1586634 RepID=A0AAV8WUJ6_9CUCU|nr:hypothetical protein NQ314_017334 [Rhamnusium bicolor]
MLMIKKKIFWVRTKKLMLTKRKGKRRRKKQVKNLITKTVSNQQESHDGTNKDSDSKGNEQFIKRKLKKKKVIKSGSINQNKNRKRTNSEAQNDAPRKKFKNMRSQGEVKEPSIPDARLVAYGINPKKFKNKLKYGNK